jgi:hypothetical protein
MPDSRGSLAGEPWSVSQEMAITIPTGLLLRADEIIE